MAILNDHLTGKTPIYQTEHRLRTKSGSWKWILDTSKVMSRDQQGNPVRVTGTHQDITERKHLEQQIVQQERLAAVGQLAAGIAHDFNNILTSILGYTELLQMTPDISVMMKNDLRKISEATERAAFLVRQMLDFSRKSIHHPEQLDMAAFIKESVESLENFMPESIRINIDITPGDNVIKADKVQLYQVLTNLANNAREAMPTGGQLKISLSQVKATGDTICICCGNPIIGNWVCLTVTDTGNGIPAETLPRIFEPFFTTKDFGEGTGLGLSQVYGIVSRHSGHLVLQSKVGQGTTVIVYLPPPVSTSKQNAPFNKDGAWSTKKGRWD